MINLNITVQDVNKLSQNTMVEHLGIECTEVGTDYIKGKMPVDARTHQPMGFLHGGASVVLAETLGSIGSASCVDLTKFSPFGLEINANHVKSVRSGFVYGTATLVHFGRNTHIWDIRIENEEKELICISRLTVAIVPKK